MKRVFWYTWMPLAILVGFYGTSCLLCCPFEAFPIRLLSVLNWGGAVSGGKEGTGGGLDGAPPF